MGKPKGSFGFTLVFIYAALIVMIVGQLVMGWFILNRRINMVSSHSLPKIDISLNGVTLEEIKEHSKNEKYYGNTVFLNDNGENYEFENVMVKGRGNASWAMDKKSYNLKFDQKINFFGLGKVKKWALVANGIDDTLMRNDLAYYIANTVDSSYKIKGDFVNVAFDGEEQGVYYLTKTVEIGKQSIDLREVDGLIVELDNPYCETEEKWEETVKMGDCFALKDTASDGKILDMSWKDFMETYNQFEEAVLMRNYAKASELVDMESLAEYYLVGEFASNPDMYVTSWFFYKDGAKDKIHSVLAWDFDAAFGNQNWGEWREDFYSPLNTMARLKYSFSDDDSLGDEIGCKYNIKDSVVSPLICNLVEMPEFREEVVKLYEEKLKIKRSEILEYLDMKSQYLRSDAITNNEMWGGGDFDEAVEYLRGWVEKRFDYFDEHYSNGGIMMPRGREI